MSNFTVQKLVLGLITFGAFLAAPWLTNEFLGGNPLPLAFLFGVGFLLLFVFVLRDNCWIAVPFCLPITGSLNILPVKFSPAELSILLVIGYAVLQMFMTKRQSVSLGPPEIWIPGLIFAGVLLYHWGKGGGLGLSMFGGEASGGRRFFTILSGMLVLPALLWFPLGKSPWLYRVPLLYLIGSILEFTPFAISSAVPALAPYIYKIYSSVNIEAYAGAQAFRDDSLVRVGQIAPLCIAMQLALLCYFSPQSWLRPSRWFVIPMSFLSFAATIWSGFRSALFGYTVLSAVALFLRARFLFLLGIPFLAGVIALLVVGQGSLFNLPLTIQRTLSPFPGKWNREAIMSADSSNDFRSNIQKVYQSDFMEKAGWLGEGYKFDAKYMQSRASDIGTRQLEESGEAQAKSFIIARDHHVGWVALHHVTGWIGFGAFAFLCLGSLFYIWRHVLQSHLDDIPAEQVWATALITQTIISFFAVFGAIQNFMPPFCVFLAVAIQSFRIQRPPFVSRPEFKA
ncbi:MAG: hypothetical protein EBZ78_08840 [Verrucomicrobia bacterium]|nr:hypothetical protein [Verrucomicrobiota bacterium]